MRLCDLAEGTMILAKYVPSDKDQDCVAAEHDELWVGSEEWPVSAEDRARLEELGFMVSDMGWRVFT